MSVTPLTVTSQTATTLNAIVGIINRERRSHVITVEDPIEYAIPGIVQTEVSQKRDYTLSSSMAKVYASETAMWTATEAVQVHGGYGYVKEYHVERLMRDAKITQIYEGTSNLQLQTIAKQLLS